MGMGIFELRSGYCEEFTLDRLLSEDHSSGLELEIAVKVSGIGIKCYVHGYSQGPISINITLAASSFNTAVKITPLTPAHHQHLPLPLGRLNVTDCVADLRVTDMTWSGSGFLFDTLTNIGNNVIPLIGMYINEPVCEGLQGFIENNATTVLGNIADFVQLFLTPPLTIEEPRALKPVIDWAEYPPLQVGQALLAERFPLWAGRMIDILNVADLNSAKKSFDDFSVKLVDIDIEGRGEQVPNVELLAQGPLVGVSANLSSMTLRSIIDVGVTLPDQPYFSQRVNVTLGLNDVLMKVRAMVDEEVLDNLKLDQAMRSPTCAMECTAGTTDPHNESMMLDTFHVGLRPLFVLQSSGTVASDVADVANAFMDSLFRSYLPTLTVLVNGVLGMLREPLDNQLWTSIDSAPPCKTDNPDLVFSEAVVHGFWWMAVFLAFVGLPISGLAQYYCTSSDKEHPQSSRGNEVSSQEAVQEEGTATSAAPSGTQVVAPTLCCESFVPRALAVYYPFAVMAVMLLFAYADLDIAATVTMVMEADGKISRIGPLFSFSLVTTVEHCWDSKAYFIAVLTVIASGVWPFIKLSGLLIAWMLPPQRLTLRVRGHLLSILDTWGKYSFLDSWFLVITLSAFAIEWNSIGDNASMKIQTTPQHAFYAFFAATVLSLVLGHVASECHKYAEAMREAPPKSLTDTEETSSRRDVRKLAEETLSLCTFVKKRSLRLTVAVAMGVSFVLSLLGVFSMAFSFRVSGVLPNFLFGHDTHVAYSLFSVGVATASGRYGDLLLLGLELVFILLAIVVPLVLLIGLLVLWLVPLSLKSQKWLLHASYMLDAWACLDVAVLVLLIACFEFGRLAEFLVYEGNFAAPCNFIKNLAKHDCLMIELIPHAGLALVFTTGAVLLLVPKITIRICKRAIRKRELLLQLRSAGDEKGVPDKATMEEAETRA